MFTEPGPAAGGPEALGHEDGALGGRLRGLGRGGIQGQKLSGSMVGSGSNSHSYRKWAFIVSFPLKNVIFHSCVRLPEGS
jgi:hypothetical protein